MSTFLGIAFDTWVNVDRDCTMTHQVSTVDVQIELGHAAGTLHLVLTADGLYKLSQLVDAAATEMRERQVGNGRVPQ